MIEARGLAKRYDATLAVDGLSFDVQPGTVFVSSHLISGMALTAEPLPVGHRPGRRP